MYGLTSEPEHEREQVCDWAIQWFSVCVWVSVCLQNRWRWKAKCSVTLNRCKFETHLLNKQMFGSTQIQTMSPSVYPRQPLRFDFKLSRFSIIADRACVINENTYICLFVWHYAVHIDCLTDSNRAQYKEVFTNTEQSEYAICSWELTTSLL